MTKRAGISKRARFRIFTRDQFTCRYCGAQADTVALVVDHVIPVVAGGTNDDENLATACEPCNQGKATASIEAVVPNETDRLRRSQEMHEQRRAAEAAREIAAAREELRNSLVTFWCEERGTDAIDKKTLAVMMSFVTQHGFEIVAEWIAMAAGRLTHSTDRSVGMYISGIRRQLLERGEIGPGVDK